MASLVAAATITINAPLEVVWSVMVDLQKYYAWNPFIVHVEDAPERPQVGARFRLHVRWANGQAIRSWETVTEVAPSVPVPAGEAASALFAYRYSAWLAQAGLVQSTREQRLSQSPGQPTLYQTQELFRGALARFVPLPEVQDGFQRHAQALKRRAEALAASGCN